jgi:RNA polymerase primary sigma factor
VSEAGRELSPTELAQRLGWPLKKVEAVIQWLYLPLSLETPTGGNTPVHKRPRTIGDMLPSIEDFDGRVNASETRAALDAAIAQLNERERQVLELRYFSGDTTVTLEKVGVQMGLTRERIRQIEAEALRKLRHPAYGAGLRQYLEIS